MIDISKYRTYKLVKSVLSYLRLYTSLKIDIDELISIIKFFLSRKNESKHNINQINLIFIFLFIIHLYDNNDTLLIR